MTKRSWRRIVAFFLLAILFLAVALERSVSHWRWPVKTMSDPDRVRVNLTPVPSSVSRLSRLPIPRGSYPRHGRIAPHELTVYRIRARLVALHRELDGDFHLVIADPDNPKASMIVEIPSPSEGRVAGLASAFRSMRESIAKRGAIPRMGWLVEVTGIGFFDTTHWQPGASRTGFELHPVLEFKFLE